MLPDANPNCPEPTSVLPNEWRPINSVSEGELTAAAPNRVVIDATAGGLPNAPDNPFIYVAFGATEAIKLAITDTESYTSGEWDLALKRSVIRTNGGDSGPARIELAAVPAASLAEVVALPEPAAFQVDDWVTDDCVLNAGQLGEPVTAFGTWYEYDPATNTLAPLELVYVLKSPNGAATKLRILTFYGGSGASANYEIEWAAL